MLTVLTQELNDKQPSTLTTAPQYTLERSVRLLAVANANFLGSGDELHRTHFACKLTREGSSRINPATFLCQCLPPLLSRPTFQSISDKQRTLS